MFQEPQQQEEVISCISAFVILEPLTENADLAVTAGFK